MNVYNKIKNDRLQMRKSKQSTLATFLALVMGDIQRRAEKEGCKDAPTDKVSYEELKAYVKRYNYEEKAYGLSEAQRSELIIVENYLPKAADTSDIQIAIDIVNPTSMKDMGKVMSLTKEKFTNVDGNLVKQLVSEYINT